MPIITPLLNKVKNGTLVTFQSTGEDMTFTFNNSNKGFRFSKFALLDLPPIVTSVDNENTIQFGNIEGAFVKGLSTDAPPPAGDITDFSQSLQNYLLNLETLILGNPNYDVTKDATIAEKVFFKWLKEIGAIRYRLANNTELSSTATTADHFVEEDPNDQQSNGNLYDRVIKYIGEVDMEGNHRNYANAMKEVYIYVPTQNGYTPTVLFKTSQDVNYYPGMTIKPLVSNEFIEGRSITDDPTTVGLTVKAFYDMDVPAGSLNYTMNGNPGTVWFDYIASNGPDAYFTESSFGDPANDLIIRQDTLSSNTITYLRSRLDGVGIDFEKSNYKWFEDNSGSTAFAEFNASPASDSFSFNTVLLYNDILDVNGNVLATNLYGILFLNDVEVLSSGGSKIKSFDKIKPQTLLSKQGNGYGIKLNIKFDPNSDQPSVDIEVSVNDYNTFSMILFTETMQLLSMASKNMESAVVKQMQLAQKLSDLEQLILTGDNMQSVAAQLEQIKEQLVDVVPNSDLLDLINNANDKINEMLKGNTSVGLDFFLDLRPFDGLKLELINNVLYFRNSRQKYSTSKEILLNVSSTNGSGMYNILSLNPFDNLYYHRNGGGSSIVSGTVYIFIDDKLNQWQLNQSMKIVIDDEIDFNNYGIAIYTDSINRFNLSAPYKKLIGAINGINSKKPVIEIVCIDATNYKFLVTVK